MRYNSEYMEYTNEDLGALIESVIENMTTKDDLSELQGEVGKLRVEVREVNTGLTSLTDTIDGMKGYAKELDDHRERITVLEEHPNLQPHAV